MAAVVTSGFIGIASLGFTFWNAQQERSFRTSMMSAEQAEKYRVGLYEQRLRVHQEAYRLLMDLIEPTRKAAASPGGTSDALATVALAYKPAREWWDANCLYLDERSRDKVVTFIEIAGVISEGLVVEPGEVIKEYRDALRAVEEGIGMKHLDIPNRSGTGKTEPRP